MTKPRSAQPFAAPAVRTALLLMMGAAAGAAQTAPARLGTVELGAGGGVFIYPNLAPAGHPSLVTFARVSFAKYLAAYGEFAYTHLAGEAGSALGVNLSGAGHLLDYGGGANVTIPLHGRIIPYGTVGFGRSDLRGSASVAGLGTFSGRVAAWNFNLGGAKGKEYGRGGGRVSGGGLSDSGHRSGRHGGLRLADG